MGTIRLLALGFALAQLMIMASGALAAEPPGRKAGDRTGDGFKDIWHVVRD